MDFSWEVMTELVFQRQHTKSGVFTSSEDSNQIRDPQLAPDIYKQLLQAPLPMSDFFTRSKAKPRQADWLGGSYSCGHYPKLVTIGEGWNADKRAN